MRMDPGHFLPVGSRTSPPPHWIPRLRRKVRVARTIRASISTPGTGMSRASRTDSISRTRAPMSVISTVPVRGSAIRVPRSESRLSSSSRTCSGSTKARVRRRVTSSPESSRCSSWRWRSICSAARSARAPTRSTPPSRRCPSPWERRITSSAWSQGVSVRRSETRPETPGWSTKSRPLTSLRTRSTSRRSASRKSSVTGSPPNRGRSGCPASGGGGAASGAGEGAAPGGASPEGGAAGSPRVRQETSEARFREPEVAGDPGRELEGDPFLPVRPQTEVCPEVCPVGPVPRPPPMPTPTISRVSSSRNPQSGRGPPPGARSGRGPRPAARRPARAVRRRRGGPWSGRLPGAFRAR